MNLPRYLLPVFCRLEYNGHSYEINAWRCPSLPMNNSSALFRSLIIYAVCVVLAIWLGYLLAGPLTYSSLFIYGGLAFILVSPILLRWHFPLLVLSWNMAVTLFFLPGNPMLGWCMIILSLGISVIQRMVSREHQFIWVPQIVLPLLAMLVAIALTAKMTGFGFRVFGSSVYGGQKYVTLVVGILGYFALSAQRIPPERKNLYLGLFFLGGLTFIIGDLIPFLPRSLYYIFWVFQPNINFFHNVGPDAEATRLSGARSMCQLVIAYQLARYGIRGIFLSRKPWRWLALGFFFTLGLFGGFRGYVISCGLAFVLQFFLEGLHRTRLMAVFLAAGVLGALALIPLADHLPYSLQRSITFLPYKVSVAARLDAQSSADWRVDMWKAILPEVPDCLLLGKGYTISSLDYDFMAGVGGQPVAIRNSFAGNQWMVLASNFHNGPLSIVIPFGIWGAITFVWFIIAGLRVLYLNYRYSPPELQTVNTSLYAAFIGHTIFFLFAFGGLDIDMLVFCGMLGLSISLNGGVRRAVRVVQPAPARNPPRRLPSAPAAPVPAFQRGAPGTMQ
jgi:hypothetical protein